MDIEAGRVDENESMAEKEKAQWPAQYINRVIKNLNRRARRVDENESMAEKEKAQWAAQYIYRVPAFIKNLNRGAYKPRTVSLGPYHYGDRELQPMESHKRRALAHVLQRAGKTEKNDLVKAMEEVAEQLLNAYTDLSDDWRRSRRRDDFLQMMATDGCFLLEVMRADAGTNLKDYDSNDPIFSVHGQLYAIPYIRNDMLMIENQLPLLVLERIVALELSARTIKVTNISVSAEAHIDNVKQFLSLCGDIEYFERRWEPQTSQVALAYYVIYNERHGADIALLFSGASIFDVSANITLVLGYDLPGPDAYSRTEELSSPRTPEGAVKKAVEVVSAMLDNGFVLSEDVTNRAQSFDDQDRHELPSSQVVSLDSPGRGVDNIISYREYSTVRIIVNRMVLKFMPSSRLATEDDAAGLHPLDISRQSLVFDPSEYKNSIIKSSAAKLYKSGIRFEVGDIGFDDKHGVLSMPFLLVDDSTEQMLLNMMAFERLHVSATNEVTMYVLFMEVIVKTAKDVKRLHNDGLIHNLVGEDVAVAKMFNRLTSDIEKKPHPVHEEMDEYIRKHRLRKKLFESRDYLSHTHFRNPWTAISLLAAIALFALAIVQTIYTVRQR
ncbi:UPF0481 protein At3g47200 isoform X2 [Brachypodium distachyon]|uniref:UPF0481 protein At3g47200 isoform X2 n=1 Tax=Brachypodium distachyon TaxID=15368 RepID=UPI00071E259E|nr:UPF0481 protein At3g47200 isoform X2 [Brachypodium distachyon]XP_014758345.1 UPF0481 protein At3g47200 isoform X2 [Brachypodium distachyon]XP_024319050.1 UPF0481 protein At3g47200 isoform X2 [Brachypodium distachyon]XP_024319051.1 UPF0481 protein At3g47200 isoform X2 [Brachypodium distachyon]|eukprot:XP_003575971.2 UPF0481 protein At3g47200 isoform X2 [Brachypodium distachyon]